MRSFLITCLLTTWTLVGCSGSSEAPVGDQGEPTGAGAPATTGATFEGSPSAHIGSDPPTGNRFVRGSLDLSAEPLRVELDEVPLWIAALEDENGLIISLVTIDDALTTMRVTDGAVVEVSTQPWDRRTSPVMFVDEGSVIVLKSPDGASPFSLPLVLDGGPVWVGSDGELIDMRLGREALIDGHIVASPSGQLAVLSDPTDEYPHGILGDDIEAATVTVIDNGSELTIDAPDGTVFEMIKPMWADIDGDGEYELLMTASNGSEGARMIAYESTGEIAATSDPIGRGSRWLNQLAVAPTGPLGETEIIEVRTPHIGGIVRWYQLANGRFDLQASASGYSTHRIRSRNVDQDIAIDVTGDERPEILVPNQDQDRLVALTRTADGAESVLSIDLPDRLTTNLATVENTDGSTTLIVGTADRSLFVWAGSGLD